MVSLLHRSLMILLTPSWNPCLINKHPAAVPESIGVADKSGDSLADDADDEYTVEVIKKKRVN